MQIRPLRLGWMLLILMTATLTLAQNGVDREITRKIIDEGEKRSQVMKNLEYMTDMIGPRLTGSKKLKRANEWTAEKFKEFGCENVHLEGFEFGRGWQRGIAYGRMTAPYEMQLDFRALAWSPGTKGIVSGPILVLDAKSPGDLDKHKGKLKDAIVLLVPPANLKPDFHPHARRMNSKEFKEEETSWPNNPPRVHGQEAEERSRRSREIAPVMQKFQEMTRNEMPALVIMDSARDHSQFEAGTGGSRIPGTSEGAPTVTMTHEHYSLLYRLAKRGVEVRVEMEARNYFEDDDTKSYNTIAEIRGSEKPNEVVILGAHLDSWDMGQGATDNGTGSIAVLEAARVLKAIGAKPKRTIRFILFGGEEQGLLGSQAYAEAHKGELAKISGVFVMDTGTGRIRGIGTEGNEQVIPIFRNLLAPFKEMGVLYVNPRVQIGTDHISFHRRGVPGFAFMQDAIEYRSSTHHTQTDTLDKVLPEDLIQASIVMAATAYNVAQLPSLLPRKQ
jgi:hypothetical protein